jgi:hypothetical protein
VQPGFRYHAVFGGLPACGTLSCLLLAKGVNQADGMASAGMHMYALTSYASSYTCADSMRLAGTTSPTPADLVPFRERWSGFGAVTGFLTRGSSHIGAMQLCHHVDELVRISVGSLHASCWTVLTRPDTVCGLRRRRAERPTTPREVPSARPLAARSSSLTAAPNLNALSTTRTVRCQILSGLDTKCLEPARFRALEIIWPA